MGRRQDLERRQALLARFGRRIAGETRLESLLTIVAEEVRDLLGADRCSVFLLDAKTQELWTKVAHGVGGKVIRIPVTKGVAGYVARSGTAVNIRDVKRDRRFTGDVDKTTGYQTKSMLCVPLKNREGQSSGVFQVLNKLKGTFTEEDEGFLRLLSTVAASSIENAQLYDDLRKSYLETIYRMALVAEFRDPMDTAHHLHRMSRYCGMIASALGLGLDEAEEIRYASPLHDVGKVGIPDAILRKPAKLTPEEYEEMKRHTIYGYQMLSNAESRLLRIAAKVAIQHHEHYDGKGYPNGLKGEEICLEARIVSVGDVFDALMSKRVYKKAWTMEETLKYMREESGKLFDPACADALFKCLPDIEAFLKEEEARAKQPSGPPPPVKAP